MIVHARHKPFTKSMPHDLLEQQNQFFFYHSFADYSVLGVEGSRGISKSDMLKIFFVIYHALPITLALC